MAVQMVSANVQARADELFARRSTWARGKARDYRGELIGVVMFSSRTAPGVVYMTRCDGLGCNCPGAQRSRSGNCCHQIAVRKDVDAARAPKPKRKYEELFGDDLVDAF